jgi:hypothetical protein
VRQCTVSVQTRYCVRYYAPPVVVRNDVDTACCGLAQKQRSFVRTTETDKRNSPMKSSSGCVCETGTVRAIVVGMNTTLEIIQSMLACKTRQTPAPSASPALSASRGDNHEIPLLDCPDAHNRPAAGLHGGPGARSRRHGGAMIAHRGDRALCLIRMANAHTHLATMRDSAELCLGDARQLLSAGRGAEAAVRALRSLAYSVGVGSPIYRAADEHCGQPGDRLVASRPE